MALVQLSRHKLVLASVPAERLLLLDLFNMSSETLWYRLCAFVRKPLPRDASGLLPPFPKMGYEDDMRLDAAARDAT